MSDDGPSVKIWGSDNPQKQLYEPIRRRHRFEPGKGMVPDEDDIDPALMVDIDDAIAESEAAAAAKQSRANVGYANMKRGR